MSKVVILKDNAPDGTPRPQATSYAGEYEVDTGTFTNREFNMIKRISGLRPDEIEDAGDHADNDLLVSIAAVAIRRAHGQVDIERIWDWPIGNIGFVPLSMLDEYERAKAEDEAAGRPVPPTIPSASPGSPNALGDESGSPGASGPES